MRRPPALRVERSSVDKTIVSSAGQVPRIRAEPGARPTTHVARRTTANGDRMKNAITGPCYCARDSPRESKVFCVPLRVTVSQGLGDAGSLAMTLFDERRTIRLAGLLRKQRTRVIDTQRWMSERIDERVRKIS
jgi:hypothetical protein